MVDLLECLVQIRALDETPRRLSEALRRAAPEMWSVRPGEAAWAAAEVLGHLADVELLHGVRLRMMLTCDRPALPVFGQAELALRAGYLAWPPEIALGRFTTRRGETLELLSSCSAAELELIGVHPHRGTMTVADLVALMLAHDTTHVGQIQQRLQITSTSRGES